MGAIQQDREIDSISIITGNKGFIKGLISLALLVAIVYSGILLGKPYYKYYSLGSRTRDYLKSEIGNVEMIKKYIIDSAVELKIPLDEKNLDVKQIEKLIKVRAEWSETVDFLGLYQKTFRFVMEEEY